jgi:MATE family multidrug resistance protein
LKGVSEETPVWRDGAWHRRVWRLAGPMVLSGLTVPLLGAVDTALVGHLEEPTYLGAVALGALVFSFLFWGFGFLRMGTTGLAAQAFGAGDEPALRATLLRALTLALLLGFLLVALQWAIAAVAFALFEAGPEVEAYGRVYVLIRIWSAPAALANFVLTGWFLATQNSRVLLVIILLVNGLNIALDLLFVLGFGLGVAGVAWATVGAEYVGLAAGLVIAARRIAWRAEPVSLARLLAAGELIRMFRVNRDIFLRTLCLLAVFVYFTNLGARQGDIILAVNAVLMNIASFYTFGVDGIAHAAEALAGGAVGEGRRAAFRRAVGVCALWSAGITLLATAIFGLAGAPVIDLLTDLEAVRGAARDYLPWVIAFPGAALAGFLLDGIFIGTTRTREMRNMMMLALALFLPLAWWLSGAYGNHGLWLAFLVFMIVRGVSLGFVFWRIERRAGFVAEG